MLRMAPEAALRLLQLADLRGPELFKFRLASSERIPIQRRVVRAAHYSASHDVQVKAL